MDKFAIDMLKKIDNGERLTEREISNLVWEYEVHRDEGEDRRWSRYNISYIQLLERYFCVEWDEGLTEMQPDEFCDQPYEVVKNTHDKTIPEHIISVTEWTRKKDVEK